MNAPTVPLETLVLAQAALQAIQHIKAGQPLPHSVAMQVAEALGCMNAVMAPIGRQRVEVAQ